VLRLVEPDNKRGDAPNNPAPNACVWQDLSDTAALCSRAFGRIRWQGRHLRHRHPQTSARLRAESCPAQPKDRACEFIGKRLNAARRLVLACRRSDQVWRSEGGVSAYGLRFGDRLEGRQPVAWIALPLRHLSFKQARHDHDVRAPYLLSRRLRIPVMPSRRTSRLICMVKARKLRVHTEPRKRRAPSAPVRSYLTVQSDGMHQAPAAWRLNRSGAL